jgi:hypothetical protein
VRKDIPPEQRTARCSIEDTAIPDRLYEVPLGLVLLWISRPFAVAAHDLDLVCLHRLTRVLHLESDVLDQECPDLITETIGIKMALCPLALPLPLPPFPSRAYYLERQARLHLLSQHLCDTAIEVRQDLHRELGLDATLADQVVEGVRERHADAKGLSVSTE